MKKKLTALALVIVMVAMLFTGLTIAYFTDTADATNTFTVGKIDIELNEESEDGEESADGIKYENVVPGVEYEKKVTVKNTGDANAAYVRVKIEMPEFMSPVWGGSTGWVVTGSNGVYTATYQKPLEAGKTTPACLKAVEMNDTVKQADLAYLGVSEFDIEVIVEAIQAEGFDSVAAAFDAFAVQNQ